MAATDLDYFQLLRESRAGGPQHQHKPVRLALLADCATQQLIPLLRALGRRNGVSIETYESPFDAIELEARNPESALYEFQPQMVVILNSVQMLRDRFYLREDSVSFLTEAAQRLTAVWDAISEFSKATIVQSNFVSPIERFFGNYDTKLGDSLASIVSQLNSYLLSEARRRGNVMLLDLESAASWVGRQSWFDERLWALAKLPCSLDHLPLVGQNIVDIVSATEGQGIKCVIVDLDNTLWGGVVGEDGPHGIRVGAHGEGEPFFRFQCFLRELRRRGILLAVCSKNDRANALQPFQESLEMALSLDDFVMFVANWENKPDNIRTIQSDLKIGFDSLLFLDDNPFERAAVRALLPDVTVPELPEDPAQWAQTLSELDLFETVSLSTEDKQRSESYRQEANRRVAAAEAPSFEAYLQSQDMRIEVNRFLPEHLGRIAQLFQRSNQFNLTTQRHNQAVCEAMMHDVAGYLPLQVSLKDRFGDYGLISIVVGRPDYEAKVFLITDWLMSCRVLTRGVEEYVMNYVFEQARSLGLNAIIGSYIPTAKNALVKDFYSGFGFAKILEQPDTGRTEWRLEVTSYRPRHVFIRAAEPARAQAQAS